MFEMLDRLLGPISTLLYTLFYTRIQPHVHAYLNGMLGDGPSLPDEARGDTTSLEFGLSLHGRGSRKELLPGMESPSPLLSSWQDVEPSWQRSSLGVEDNIAHGRGMGGYGARPFPNPHGGGTSPGLASLEEQCVIESRLRDHLLARGTRGL